jgi:hypothetical protein
MNAPSVLERLSTALAERYVLEREIGQGAMIDSRLVEMHHHGFVRRHQRHVGSRRARTGHPVRA